MTAGGPRTEGVPTILFASGEPFLPAFSGGAERTVDGLVRALRARGVDAEVLAGLARGAERKRHRLWRFATARRRLARRDARNGYPTWRTRNREVVAALAQRLDDRRPDLVVSWNRASEALARVASLRGVASLLWIHDAEFAWREGALPAATRVAAVSEFLAERARRVLGRPVDVVRSLVDLDAYRVARRPGGFVVFANPRVTKGRDLALEVARLLPGRRFLFVGSRWLPEGERAALASLAGALPNVLVEPSASDMREVYARASVVLVPSRCEDASPRVVLEAQVNGIPVVATRIGGIPEVGGSAAVLLDPSEPPEAWAAAVERVFADAALREDLSRRSVENAARPELGREAVVESFLLHASEAIESSRRARGPSPGQ